MKQSMFTQMKSAICKNTSHQWGEWILDDGICSTTRRCKRCGAEGSRKVDHIWSEWILDSCICSTTRKCKRCKAEETKEVEHAWGDWQLLPNQCVEVRICSHCRQRETWDSKHDWCDWFINDECRELRKCNRCGKEDHGSGKTKHTWGEWKNTEKYNCGNGNKIRECERCHQIEKSTIDLIHLWDTWILNKKSCTTTRKCKRCKAEETQEVEHAWGPLKIKELICVEVRECVNCGKLDYSDIKNPSKIIHHDYECVNESHVSTRYYTVSDNQTTWRCEWKCQRCGHVEFNEYDDWYGHRHPPD